MLLGSNWKKLCIYPVLLYAAVVSHSLPLFCFLFFKRPRYRDMVVYHNYTITKLNLFTEMKYVWAGVHDSVDIFSKEYYFVLPEGVVEKNKIKHDCKILNSTTNFSNIIYILSFHLVQFELIFLTQ